MPTRILHVSDLHFGARNALSEPAAEEAIGELVKRLEPALVIASGDLTHRGRAEQYDEALRFLHGLRTPLLVVPGNHDIPHTFPARFTRPWREFERRWQTTEPVLVTDGAHVVGVNSVQPWRHQAGRVRPQQLARAALELQSAAPGALRVVVLHHQLVGAPWRSRKRPVANRSHVLAHLVDAGAELIVGGHIHQASVAERHEFEVLEAGARSAVVATAPGFRRPRPHRHGEARGVLVYTADEQRLVVETYIWREGAWAHAAERIFARRA